MFSCSDIPSFRSKKSLINRRLQDRDPTSKSYSRWRPSNKCLHADQFSSATLKFYRKCSAIRTVGKKTLDEGFTVIWGFYSDCWEEETDYNQHHSLVQLVADDSGGITCEPPVGPENDDGSDIKAKTAEPVPSTSSTTPPFVRRWESWGGGTDQCTTLTMARGDRCSLYWSVTGNCRKYHSKYLIFKENSHKCKKSHPKWWTPET